MMTFSEFIERVFWFRLIKSPTVVVTSYFIPSWVLFVYRVIVLAYILFIRLYSWISEKGDGYYFFTIMSHEVLMLYFMTAVILSIIMKSWRINSKEIVEHEEYNAPLPPLSPTSSSSSSMNSSLLTRKFPTYDIHVFRFSKFVVLLGETISTTAPIVVMVYWTLLAYPLPNAMQVLLNTSVHLLNWPMIWIDMAMNRITSQDSHVLYVLFQCFLFTCWAWFFHAITNMWIYFFLDYTQKGAYVYYLGVTFAFALIYFVVYGLLRLRNFLAKKLHNRQETRLVERTSLTVEFSA